MLSTVLLSASPVCALVEILADLCLKLSFSDMLLDKRKLNGTMCASVSCVYCLTSCIVQVSLTSC